jgi:hypothetical protein
VKDRFSATPATQSTSKVVALELGMEARLETTEESWIEVDLSLCCSVTLIKQSTPPLALESHGKLPNDTNRGKDNEDSEIVSFVWLTFLGSSIVAD